MWQPHLISQMLGNHAFLVIFSHVFPCERDLLTCLCTDKNTWIGEERIRWARHFSVPVVQGVPEGFPPLTLTIMRALCAVTILKAGEKDQRSLIACLDALFAAYWVDGKKTNEKDILAEELTRVLGAEDAGKGECSSSCSHSRK